jgi:hypothetical protein
VFRFTVADGLRLIPLKDLKQNPVKELDLSAQGGLNLFDQEEEAPIVSESSARRTVFLLASVL